MSKKINKIMKDEQKITDWAVALQRTSRLKSNRYEELKKLIK